MLSYKQDAHSKFFSGIIADQSSQTKKFSLALAKVISDRLPLVAPQDVDKDTTIAQEELIYELIDKVNNRVPLDHTGLLEKVHLMYSQRVGVAYPESRAAVVYHVESWHSGGNQYLSKKDMKRLGTEEAKKFHDIISNYLKVEARRA